MSILGMGGSGGSGVHFANNSFHRPELSFSVRLVFLFLLWHALFPCTHRFE
jgi:hypothetical protein